MHPTKSVQRLRAEPSRTLLIIQNRGGKGSATSNKLGSSVAVSSESYLSSVDKILVSRNMLSADVCYEHRPLERVCGGAHLLQRGPAKP